MSLTCGAERLNTQKFDTAAEEALVAQCRRQDYAAFGRIVDAYQARILGFVRRMLRNEEEAHDVTQEVFIKAYQAMERFDGRSSLRTWLFKIAYNLCIDRARRSDRTIHAMSFEADSAEGETYEVSDTRWNPEEVVLNDELFEIVNQSIETMSDKLRTVLLMHDKEDMSYEEIASATSVPVGTVKSRLFLARAHLQKSVADYYNTGGRK